MNELLHRFRLSPESLICRRLLRPDIPQLCALYGDFFVPNARPTCPEIIARFDAGECYGIFFEGRLSGAVTALPLSARISPATELRGLLPTLSTDAKLLCDIAFASPLPAPAEALLAALLSFAEASAVRGGAPPTLCAVLPVKTATGLRVLFEAGFLLRAVRPLVRLCPCYIFSLNPAVDRHYAMTAPQRLADTLTLSRRLEEGWEGYNLLSGETLLLGK